MAEKKEVFTDCTLCYHSCGAKVTVEDGKAIKIKGLESHPINRGKALPQGGQRAGGHLQPRSPEATFETHKWPFRSNILGPGLGRNCRKTHPPERNVWTASVGTILWFHRRRESGDVNPGPSAQVGFRLTQFLFSGKYLLPHAHPNPPDDLRSLPYGRTRFQSLHTLGTQSRSVRFPPQIFPRQEFKKRRQAGGH